jgi:prefoldin subunit 5
VAEVNKIVGNLEVKIGRMIDLHKTSVASIEKLTREKNELTELVNQQKSEITALTEKVKMIKLAKSVGGSGEESAKFKLKINEVVREVDKCIAMLNK